MPDTSEHHAAKSLHKPSEGLEALRHTSLTVFGLILAMSNLHLDQAILVEKSGEVVERQRTQWR